MTALFPFQKDSVEALLNGKRMVIAPPGTGKTAVLFQWLEQSHATHILIVTTAQKAHSGDMDTEMVKFTSATFRRNIKQFDVVSWDLLYKWMSDKTPKEMSEYHVVYDEVQKSKAGVSSRRGKAFLFISEHCKSWTGYTGTAGDTWSDYCAYFIADGKVRNKTAFQREFCIMQHYPFPMVLKYQNVATLKKWWSDMSYIPDTSIITKQLPRFTNQIIKVPAPKGYKKVLKTSTTLDGEFLDSNMALLHELRQMCATPDKLSALSDLLESLSSPLVLFYNYTCEREQILGLVQKLGRKVWRIDGECHEIPTDKTIGEKDIVLCHYLSGSEALNLQFCNYWLSYSHNYSYSTTKQAMGRIRRVGQDKPQFYYWLWAEGTVEDDIAKALHDKGDFVKELWSPERS